MAGSGARLLGINGRGQNRVMLFAGRGRRPGWGMIDRDQVEAGLLLALNDHVAVRVGGILHPKEFVLNQGVVQQLFVREQLTFFRKQLGDREHAGICFGRRGIVVINGAIGIEHKFVVWPVTTRFGPGLERLAQVLRLLIRGQMLRWARVKRNRGEQNRCGAHLQSRRHAASRTEPTEQTRGMEHRCFSGPETRTPELTRL